jgi:signal transduction histidine kinase
VTIRLCAIFIFSISAFAGWAQNQDSLIRVALAAPFDTSRVILLNKAAFSLRETDSNLALTYAEQARLLADSIDFTRGLGPVLSNIGWIYYRKGFFTKALDYSTQSLKLSQEINDKKEIAQVLNNIGAINFEKKLFVLAIVNFKSAYALAKEMDGHVTMSRSLNNVAFCFLRLRQLDSSRHYINLSIAVQMKDNFQSGISYRTLGDISFEEGKYSVSLRNYQTCLTGAENQNNNFLRASTLFRIGKVYLKLNDIDQALNYFNQNLALTKKFDYNSERESTLKLMADAFAARNNFSQAFDLQRQYITLHDSLLDQKNGEQINLIQTQFDLDLKNTQIELLTKKSGLKEQEIKTQRIWIYVAIGGLILLLAIVAIMIRTNRNSRKLNQMLAEKNNLINEQTAQLIALNSTKDKLFSIIGHDLRSPLNSLSGLLTLLGNDSMTQEEFVEFSKKLKTNIDFVSSDIENLLSWAQTQQQGLSASIGEVSISKAVQEKIDLHNEAIKAKDIRIINEVDQSLIAVADKNHIGLVLRNLIGNAIKFNNRSGQVILRSALKAGMIELSVTDTGTGMTAEEIKKLFKPGQHFSKPGTNNEKGIGLGLLLVKEFVELNHGKIWVESDLGQGSTFTFSLKAK